MKVGDRVSVLDDDLKGKIISIKNEMIKIRDDYGFDYEFHQSKLVLQNQDFYQNISVNQKEDFSKIVSKKHQKNQLKLDLHFDKLVDFPNQYESWERFIIQREKLVETLEYCKEKSVKKLVIIHGLGEGVLQEMIYEVLRGYSGVDFEENDFFRHQSTEIEVVFR